jgi:hypothetical protein
MRRVPVGNERSPGFERASANPRARDARRLDDRPRGGALPRYGARARTGELEDAAASILVSACQLDFHGDPDSDPRFTIVSLTEPVLIAAAREAARHALRA